MKLYHLSFDVNQSLTRTFTPRVPGIKMADEDFSVPRVCFSHNILGCVNAIPEIDNHLERNWDEKQSVSKAVLFCIDTRDFSSLKFLDSNVLYERGLVPDAVVNQECWCLSPVTMTGKVVDLCVCSDKARTLYSAKEENRDFIYSVIDRVCEGYATENKEDLDGYSLTYLMNYYFEDTDLDWDMICDLDFEFCDIANSPTTSHLIDSFIVYPDFYVNNVLHSLEEYAEEFADRSPCESIALSDQILAASSVAAKTRGADLNVGQDLRFDR